jgi:hypothetical protein
MPRTVTREDGPEPDAERRQCLSRWKRCLAQWFIGRSEILLRAPLRQCAQGSAYSQKYPSIRDAVPVEVVVSAKL